MTYILAIILIFFALPFIIRKVILPILQWWLARKVARMQQQAFDQAFGGAFAGAGRSAADSDTPRPDTARASSPHRRGKRIDPSVGEYVDYEEIEGVADAPAYGADSADNAYVTESRIEDVEWEDVK